MSLHAYKMDQGYWTRTCSAIAGGGLVLSACVWIWNQLQAIRFEENTRFWIQVSAAGLIGVLGSYLILSLVYFKPKTVEFLIATEGEMKKVNWSSRREVLGSTWVVIAVSLSIALILLLVDHGFSTFFVFIKVLQPGG